jgi:hypothetical protein
MLPHRRLLLWGRRGPRDDEGRYIEDKGWSEEVREHGAVTGENC